MDLPLNELRDIEPQRSEARSWLFAKQQRKVEIAASMVPRAMLPKT
jgi:hypothetical protein